MKEGLKQCDVLKLTLRKLNLLQQKSEGWHSRQKKGATELECRQRECLNHCLRQTACK